MITSTERDSYYEHGYLICRQIFSPEHVAYIKLGVQRIIDQAKSGEGKDIPWINKEKGIPERLSYLLSPDYFQPEIAFTLEESPIIDIIEGLLEGPVRYSLAGMLASGDGKGYSLPWHRDLAPTEGSGQLTQLIRAARNCCQLNAPLFQDRYLKIVPGSHIRATSSAEIDTFKNIPNGEMPGELTVELEPGDIVFYNPNLIHTGYNPEGSFRWTLHYTFWRSEAPHWSLELKQLEWIENTDFQRYGPRIRTQFERFVNSPR
ncbi:phytanoyl-CoA dioxygenase family protein [Paenibacillus silvisoli]|uniref:phytanoyl-CoA dioxygenase family protein n=1 Tax=Paenibacillus silvisoli TaxID=3110539 RepID=UPI002804A9FA|nr:phytanoyl-CoA dioxygenase family protein [Paenibacillus silvisoli]